MRFRPLKPEEIDVRVGGVYEKGVTLLLYKDARVDMAILDETVGEANWQRDHKEVKGNLYCGIGIRSCLVDDKITATDEWVWKWDCGTESYTEKEKGEASDSFKRAGFNWGIGRELYTSPFIWVDAETKAKDPHVTYKSYELTQNGKALLRGLGVLDIGYEETENARKINRLVICNQKGQVLFSQGVSKSWE